MKRREIDPADLRNRALGRRAGKHPDLGLADDRVLLFNLAKALPEARRQFFAQDRF